MSLEHPKDFYLRVTVTTVLALCLASVACESEALTKVKPKSATSPMTPTCANVSLHASAGAEILERLVDFCILPRLTPLLLRS